MRPALPTPTSPSEAVYGRVVLRDGTIYTEKINVEVATENPQRKSSVLKERGPEASDLLQKESTDNVVPPQESTGFSATEQIMSMEFTKKQDTKPLGSMDSYPKDERIDCLSPMDLETCQETLLPDFQEIPWPEPQDDLRDEIQELQQQGPPLEYGDLVVAEYAEKKKMYKYPAIVSSNPGSCLTVDCASGTYD